MALRKIICIEDELLRKKSRPVEKFDEKLHKLLDDMAETMYNANGVGLAAPQVAVLRRVVVMDCGDGLIEMINPEILETAGEQDGPEGCLSVPGRRGMVKRPMKVRAKFQDRNGEWYEIEAEELLARCPQLDGVICVTDTVAFGALQVLRAAGRRVGEDVGLAGIGDNWASKVVQPGLTTIRFYQKQVGQEAARMLLQSLEHTGPDAAPVRQTTLGYTLVERGSL